MSADNGGTWQFTLTYRPQANGIVESVSAFASPLRQSCGLGKYCRAAVPNVNFTGV